VFFVPRIEQEIGLRLDDFPLPVPSSVPFFFPDRAFQIEVLSGVDFQIAQATTVPGNFVLDVFLAFLL